MEERGFAFGGKNPNTRKSLNQYVYHLVPKTVAVEIKKIGLQSTHKRTGKYEAAETGAFVQDRKANRPDKILERLQACFISLLELGYSKDQIEKGLGEYFPFSVQAKGDDEDGIRRDDQVKDRLERYKQLYLGKPADKAWDRASRSTELSKWRGKSSIYLPLFLQLKPTHYLVKLSEEYTDHYYRTEEIITTQHIYFFTEQYASDCYDSYTKHLNSFDLVMLRVYNDGTLDFNDDMSEFRAVRTQQVIGVDKIQIMVNVSQFRNEQYRKNAQNWQNLETWTP